MKRDATFDTSFWANAFRAGLLPHILERFALRYTPQVAGELPETNPGGREFWRLVRAGEVVAAAPAILHLHEHGEGERSAISLALEHPDWTLLIDDRRPFLAAQRLGLAVISTPMLVVWLAGQAVVSDDEVERLLGDLARFNTVSPHLIRAARLLHTRLRSDPETAR